MSLDPHAVGEVAMSGTPITKAIGAVIILHGRGGSAEEALSLACPMELPELAYLAPQASANSWYPNTFLAPVASNQPWLSSALGKIASLLAMLEESGIGAERVVIGGFSQGACLAAEFVAGHPRRYAGLFALTGGLIGPLGEDLTQEGDLSDTPVFFGSNDPDPHVPWSRVLESAHIFQEMGAQMTLRRYEGRGHTISGEEVDVVRQMLHGAFYNAERKRSVPTPQR